MLRPGVHVGVSPPHPHRNVLYDSYPLGTVVRMSQVIIGNGHTHHPWCAQFISHGNLDHIRCQVHLGARPTQRVETVGGGFAREFVATTTWAPAVDNHRRPVRP